MSGIGETFGHAGKKPVLAPSGGEYVHPPSVLLLHWPETHECPDDPGTRYSSRSCPLGVGDVVQEYNRQEDQLRKFMSMLFGVHENKRPQHRSPG